MSGMTAGSAWVIAGGLVTAMLFGLSGCAKRVPVEVIEEANSAQKDFLLGPEDVLEIAVWRNQDLTQKEEIVRPDGKISMPLIGEVVASGRTANQLAAHITDRLKEFKENPSVSVRVKESSFSRSLASSLGSPCFSGSRRACNASTAAPQA